MSPMDEKHWAWLKGDRAAFDLITNLFAVAHFWDDLIDGDRAIPASEINDALWKALVAVPENPFYQQHFKTLMPVLKLAICNWTAANRMERGPDGLEKQIAFVLRSAYVDLVTVCACIIGGPDWAAQVAYECRKDTSQEGFEAYLDALTKENRKE